jgi:hypothetical protein
MQQDENPYVNEDEYAAEWASVIDDARSDPRDGLDDLLDIVDRIRTDRGTATEALDPEIGLRLEYAREIVAALDRGDDVEDGDVAAALAAVEAVYATTRAPGDGGDPGSVDPGAADQMSVEFAAGDQGESDPDV